MAISRSSLASTSCHQFVGPLRFSESFPSDSSSSFDKYLSNLATCYLYPFAIVVNAHVLEQGRKPVALECVNWHQFPGSNRRCEAFQIRGTGVPRCMNNLKRNVFQGARLDQFLARADLEVSIPLGPNDASALQRVDFFNIVQHQ